MTRMTRDEWRQFLSERPRTAKLATVRKISERYMHADDVEAAAERNAVEGELLVRVPFTKVIATRGVAA